jgi:tripartite-type tricarboxylate transporter receptor subunit TctC
MLDRFAAEATKVTQSAEVRQKLEGMGFRVSGTSREEFAAIVRNENVTWGKAIKATGFKAD